MAQSNMVELETIRRAQQGDQKAMAIIIRENMPLVRRIVGHILKNKYLNTLEWDDLIQEGQYGLMEAVRKFNPKKQAKFQTYASYWIKQCVIRRIVYEDNYLKRPAWTWQFFNQINSWINEYEQTNGTKPTIHDIAEHFNVTETKVNDILSIYKSSFGSLDSPLGDGDDSTAVDFIGDEYDTDIDDEMLLYDIQCLLTPDEYNIFEMYYLHPNSTQEEIADILQQPIEDINNTLETIKVKLSSLLNSE